jgi:hypothetical protein
MEFEVDSEGNGFENVPSEVLIELMFNVMEELADRLTRSKAN